MTTLTCRRVAFFAVGDEEAFFHWLANIPSIIRVEGQGDALLLHVSSKRISERSLRELLALFRRYKISMKQLAQFEHESNRKWFRDPKAFWHRAVFTARAA